MSNDRPTVNNKIWSIYVLLAFIILTPYIKIKSLPGFRLEQVVVIIFTFYTFIKLTLGNKIKITNRPFLLLYSSFSLLIIISIMIGSLKGVKVVSNDFFEIYKIYIYVGVYLITTGAVGNKNDKIKILKFAITCLLISVVISIQQYYNLFNLNEMYVEVITPTHFKSLINNYPYPRVVGMTSNPNVYSVMSGIGAVLSWSLFNLTKKKRNLLYMVIFILAVLITLSRSGFVFTVSALFTFTFLYAFKTRTDIGKLVKGRINKKVLKNTAISILFLLLLVFVIFYCLPEGLNWRLLRGIDIGTDSSFQARIRNWKEHIDYFKSSPLFGIGPAKSIQYEKHVDNEWLLFLRRYGLVGCMYIIFTFVAPFIGGGDKFFKYIYLSILVGCFFYMIPAIVYHEFQLTPLIFITAGLISSSYENTGHQLDN